MKISINFSKTIIRFHRDNDYNMKEKTSHIISNKKKHVSKIIVQSNVITMSKQSWTLLEKKVFYIILSQLDEYRRLNEKIDMNNDLFLKFDGKLLLKADKHITRACEVLKSLQNRFIEIRHDKKYIVIEPFKYSDYDVKTHQVKIQVSNKILPYYFNLTRRFTLLELNTALECKSVYSQRLFEICSMFAVSGLFSLNIKQMKELFCIDENKYTDKNDLIRWVVKSSQVELFDLYNKNLSSLFFTFFEKNSQIIFLVHQHNKPNRTAIGWAKMVAVLLAGILEYDQSVIDDILIKYSVMHTMTDFSKLFREFAAVKIHMESRLKQRAQIIQILYRHSIYPNQNQTSL